MYDYLLEIFCEEIPARMQKYGSEALKKNVTCILQEHGLFFKAANIYWTPRRLCLDIRGLSAFSQEKIIERKGPSVNAPQTALLGFARSCGLASLDEAHIIEDTKKGKYYLAKIKQKGRSAFDIISEYMPIALKQLSWLKSMRWGENSIATDTTNWVRPIQNITSILYNEIEGTQVVPFKFAGVEANNYSFGHRFLSENKPIIVKNFDDYIDKLSKAYVILDAARRKNLIKDAAENIVFANGLEIVADEALLDEVVNLIEYPVVLLGEFNTNFLELPSRVIQTTIRENQKCFVTKKFGSRELANKFVICANIKAADGGALIVKGNERVVDARLKDALYFYNKDNSHLCPLDYFIQNLRSQYISTYTQLGTQDDRLVRILSLGLFIADKFGYENQENLKRAVELSKADLFSEMVKEFANLQGYIGSQYALKQGENSEVARAIEEHYKPQGALDNVPKNCLSIILGLADRIDMLAGFWLVGEKPSGSRDPFALRRTALGIVRLLLAQERDISLIDIIEKALNNFSIADKTLDLYNFISERFKNYLREEGARYDAIEAIMQVNNDNLLYQARMIEALILYIDSEDGLNFIQATKRINNILACGDKKHNFKPELESSAEAIKLYKAVENITHKIPIKGKKDFTLLNELTPYIESFFANAMVNDTDEAIKSNRIALLYFVEDLTMRFADFTKIVVS